MPPCQQPPGALQVLRVQRRTASKAQGDRKAMYDYDQIHARVFHSLKMGHRLPLFVKFRPSPANVVTR